MRFLVIYSKNKEIQKMIKREVQLGASFFRKGKHGKLLLPKGGVLIVPTSPSDYRAPYNLRAQLRKLIQRTERVQ
jgi:hypothetical protein